MLRQSQLYIQYQHTAVSLLCPPHRGIVHLLLFYSKNFTKFQHFVLINLGSSVCFQLQMIIVVEMIFHCHFRTECEESVCVCDCHPADPCWLYCLVFCVVVAAGQLFVNFTMF